MSPIVEVAVTCEGCPGPSGYLIDITEIDRACRSIVAPIVRSALKLELFGGEPTDICTLLREFDRGLSPALSAPVAAVSYRTCPFRSATIERRPVAAALSEEELSMHTSNVSHTFILSETFEFAASHRLHLSGESDDANRALFGKCNNPNGHGHNYRIDVAVEVDPERRGRGGALLDFRAIELVVDREIMARFDHKHLNLDCPEFAELNPSVEHIAMVCHGLLAPRFAELGGRLRFVEVWETGKTSCRYPA